MCSTYYLCGSKIIIILFPNKQLFTKFSEIDYPFWDGMRLTKLVVPIQAVHVLAFSISDAFLNSWYLYEVFYKRSGFKVFLPSDFHCGKLHWILINSFLDGTCDHSICFCLLRALWLLSRSRVGPTLQSVFLDDSSLSYEDRIRAYMQNTTRTFTSLSHAI